MAALLICSIPLTPFVIALAVLDRRGWFRVLTVVIPGLFAVACILILFFLAGLVLYPTSVFDLVFGLMALGPCWSRGDASGRALAILGILNAIPNLNLIKYATTPIANTTRVEGSGVGVGRLASMDSNQALPSTVYPAFDGWMPSGERSLRERENPQH